MPEIDLYFDEIDAARIRRTKELSELKRRFRADSVSDPESVHSKATVVLTYANWEGFYNECVRSYVRFLKEQRKKVRETDWMLLVCAFNSDFESLRATNHSSKSKRQFVANLKGRLECGFDALDCTIIEARSNLDYERLSENFGLLSFDLASLQTVRNRLDIELVGWRHSVAHGDAPDLSAFDIAAHVDFTARAVSERNESSGIPESVLF
jgi:hypothetical protein